MRTEQQASYGMGLRLDLLIDEDKGIAGGDDSVQEACSAAAFRAIFTLYMAASAFL